MELQPPNGRLWKSSAAIVCLDRGYDARVTFGMIGGIVTVNHVAREQLSMPAHEFTVGSSWVGSNSCMFAPDLYMLACHVANPRCVVGLGVYGMLECSMLEQSYWPLVWLGKSHAQMACQVASKPGRRRARVEDRMQCTLPLGLAPYAQNKIGPCKL